MEQAPLIAPAMNDAMYRHAAVQQNIKLLKKRGCVFIGPTRGRLASGKQGLGRLASIDDIVAATTKVLRKKRKS